MINNIWIKYPKKMRKKYEKYLEIYGSLSNLFNQKKDKNKDNIPQLDPKFQETIYQNCFTNNQGNGIISKEEDLDNTPHDILSVFPNGERVGIGLKTWRGNKTYQKVAQMKKHHNHIMSIVNRYKNTGDPHKKNCFALRLVLSIARIKNTRLTKDYRRLEIDPRYNIYSYVTRRHGHMLIQETNYPRINVHNIKINNIIIKGPSNDPKRILFFDGRKHYKFTFSDSQCYMQFNSNNNDHLTVADLHVQILKDPLKFLSKSYDCFILPMKQSKGLFIPNTPIKDKPVYLPLYSTVGNKKTIYDNSGLNASFGNDGYKDKAHTIPRPDYEVYIPVPAPFRRLNKYWFNPNIDISNASQYKHRYGKSYYAFKLHLPNGKIYNARLTQSDFKALISKPQNAIGSWIVKSLFHKKPSERVSMQDLYRWDWGSVMLWHKIPNDYKDVWIDVKPVNAYEHFINKELRNK